MMTAIADFLQGCVALLAIEVKPDNIGRIVGTLGFASSFITYFATSVLQRPSMVPWRKVLFFILLLQWLSILLGLLELIRPISLPTVPNVGLKLGVVMWGASIAVLLVLVRGVTSLAAPVEGPSRLTRLRHRCGLGRSLRPFDNEDDAPTRFGVACMDRVATQFRTSGKRLRFPVLLVHDRGAPGLKMARAFLVAGLEAGEGAVYLTFTRPAAIIRRQLREALARDVPAPDAAAAMRRVVIIDCYSTAFVPGRLDDGEVSEPPVAGVERRDPRNPLDVYRGYRSALLRLQGKGLNRVRVLYDSLTDFLSIADQELVVNYLRHAIVWEEGKRIKAVHLLWRDVVKQPLNDEQLAWFSNSVLWLTCRPGCVSLYDLIVEAAGRERMEMTVDDSLSPVALSTFMIDERRVARMAEIVAGMGYRPIRFDDPRLVPHRLSPEGLRHYFFFLTAIDHETHGSGIRYEAEVNGSRFHGSDLLYRLASQADRAEPALFTPAAMRAIDADKVAAVFTAPNGRSLPDPELRAALLRDAAERLIAEYDGDLGVLFARAGNRLVGRTTPGIRERLARFQAYADPLAKKTNLLVKLLRRERLLTLRDEENIDIPVDPVVMTAALRSGVVQCTEKAIADQLARGEPLGDETVPALRRKTADAFRQVAARSGLAVDALDDLLWGYGREAQAAKDVAAVTSPLDANVANIEARNAFLAAISGLDRQGRTAVYTVARGGGGWFY